MKREQNEAENGLTNLEFTDYARRSVEKTTQDPYFRDMDPELILEALMTEIRTVSFGDYLKRYVRKQQQAKGIAEPEDDVEYVCGEFRKRDVPPSFTPTTAKLKALVKNWLTQRAVARNVVLLLGFALEMTPVDVNEFLAKALREPRLDPKEPFEVICWYCYRYQLPYSRFEALWNRFASDRPEQEQELLIRLDSTVHVRTRMESIRTEAELEAYLNRLGFTRGSVRQSVSARKQFDRLYQKARETVADMKTEMDRDDASKDAGRFAEQISRNDRFYDFQKRERIEKRRETYHVYTAEEISPGDIENVLYSAVPKDRNGNLIPMKESLLNLPFSGKRLNRQHLAEILEGTGSINRFDLITLSFFAAAGETDCYDLAQDRYNAFILSSNQALKDSDMDPLYAANPYESFLMMCMLTDDPLGSFADVWEMSYDR